MRRISLLQACIILHGSIYAENCDTTIAGVPVVFDYSIDIFPSSWQTAPTSAYAEEIDSTEIIRSKFIIANAFSKYPEGFLNDELRAVYIVKTMSFFDVGFGGTNSNDAVYLTNNSSNSGYTDEYIEQTFHHEFSSILIRNYPNLIDREEWQKISDEGNTDPEGGVGAIRNNAAGTWIDTSYCNIGFLTQYSTSDFENDVNMLAQNLFSPFPGFWDIVDEFPLIKRKTELLIAFYHNLDPQFTESYFKTLY